MIAADTSTWIGFLEGDGGDDIEMLAKALGDRQVVMVPPVLTELLSDPELSSSAARTLSDVPLIEIESGYWQRAGRLRARVLAQKRKARLGDALIAHVRPSVHGLKKTGRSSFERFCNAAKTLRPRARVLAHGMRALEESVFGPWSRISCTRRHQ